MLKLKSSRKEKRINDLIIIKYLNKIYFFLIKKDVYDMNDYDQELIKKWSPPCIVINFFKKKGKKKEKKKKGKKRIINFYISMSSVRFINRYMYVHIDWTFQSLMYLH